MLLISSDSYTDYRNSDSFILSGCNFSNSSYECISTDCISSLFYFSHRFSFFFPSLIHTVFFAFCSFRFYSELYKSETLFLPFCSCFILFYYFLFQYLYKNIFFFFQCAFFSRAIIYWVYNSVMVLPSKKYKIDFTENSYR